MFLPVYFKRIHRILKIDIGYGTLSNFGLLDEPTYYYNKKSSIELFYRSFIIDISDCCNCFNFDVCLDPSKNIL